MERRLEEPKKGFHTNEKPKKVLTLEETCGDEEGLVRGGGGGGGGEEEKRRRLYSPIVGGGGCSYSSTSSMMRKGIGGGDGGVQPCCQVERCTADLTDAKRYHRRHKVCEVHSKAAAVVVAGISQRFCQQCSRFHELSEFDETKRSCRRRLAGHNERRRKISSEPQEEDSSRCRQADQDRKSEMNLTGAPTYKHFQIR